MNYTNHISVKTLKIKPNQTKNYNDMYTYLNQSITSHLITAGQKVAVEYIQGLRKEGITIDI